MKKLKTLSILFTIFFSVLTHSNRVTAQTCQDIALSSQAQVDAFTCTEVIGRLIISGEDITNLDNLSSLTKVGVLSIVDNPNLQTLDGLSGLRSVDASLGIGLNPILTNINALSFLEKVGSLAISGNSILTNLDGLSSLTEITEGPLDITDNPQLIDISGLFNLNSINLDLRITNNESLNQISGFNNLTTIRQLLIQDNSKLIDINGFNSLVTLNQLSIHRNDILTNLQGFSALKSVDYFEINENNQLSSIEGFPSLKSAFDIFLTKNVELSNINAFVNIDSIHGELRIENADKLVDLNGLSSLKYAGSISVSDNNSIVNINGLANLSELGEGNGRALITGIAYSLEISYNPMLANLDGLSSLTKAKGPIRIKNNSSLESIAGFSSLSEINGPIDINNNPSLKSLKGFQGVTLISYHFLFGESGVIIDRNYSLTEFTALSSLKTIQGGFPILQISNNNSLLNIDALSNLTSITGIVPKIHIYNNSSLKDIDGLSSLAVVTDKDLELIIYNNSLLENIDGISALGSEVQDTPSVIRVTQNPSLTHCDGLLPYFLSLGVEEVLRLNGLGRIQVNENGAGCTVQDIFAGGSIIVRICDGEIVLTHQAEVDAFTCTEVSGNLRISGDDITNLNGLSSLKKVGGNFFFQNTSNLKTLDGLSALDSVTGSLYIIDNHALTNINGLSSLKSVGSVNVIGNSGLTNLDGFSSLSEIKNGGMYISNNANLVDISGSSSLRSSNGSVIVENNGDLTNISGFNNLVTLQEITISGNPKLCAIKGFNSLVTIKGENNFPYLYPDDLTIEGNNSLADIQGFLALTSVNNIRIINNDRLSNLSTFSSLKSVSGDILLSDNAQLSTLNGFNYVDSIAGDLRIENNYKLTDLTGFSSLNSAGDLMIRNNFNLTNLDGFLSLTKLYSGNFNDGNLLIEFNQNLNNISGFNNLDSLGGVSIYDNPKLVSVSGFASLVAIKNTPGEVHGVPGGLFIGLNDDLTDIQGFSALTYVGSLSINGNNSLTTINSLSNLTRLGAGGLDILNNAALENLDGLSAIREIYSVTGGPIFVNVTQNPSLNSCCGLRPLLELLGVTEPNFYVQISENGSGCTVEDILVCGPQKISKFSVINLRNGQEVFSFYNDSVTVDLAHPDFRNLAIQANTFPEQVGSVEFRFDDKIKHTENVLPYTFTLPHHLKVGAYTITADVYSEAHKKGEKGIGRMATIIIIRSVAVVSFDIVNTSGKFVRRLNEGDVIDINDRMCKGTTIVANTTGQIGSVKFDLNNQFHNVENAFPYTLTGDNGTYFTPWTPQACQYTLTATPYSLPKASGDAGKPLTIHFSVVEKNHAGDRRIATNGPDEKIRQEHIVPDVKLYPVPVDDELHVKIDDLAGGKAVVTIRNVQGLTVYQDSYSKSQNINTLHLQAGVYFLQVVGNGGFQKVVKFIKN